MRPRPSDYLQPGERILVQERRHPLSVLDEILGIFVMWLVFMTAGWFLLYRSGVEIPPQALGFVWGFLVFVTLAAAASATYRLFRMLTSLYTITGARVYEAHGRIWFHLLQTTYDRVTDLHVRQSFFGRVWGFGTVTLQTAGTGLPLRGIRDPLQVKRAVEAARSRFLTQLAGSARAPQSGTAVVPEAAAAWPEPAEGGLVWQGRPSPASLVAGLLAAVPVAIFALIMLTTGALRGGSTWIPGIIATVLFLGMAIRRIIQYATTRFEVRTTGLVVTTGWLSRSRVEATYEKVTDLAMNQTMVGRMFGFGTIQASTAGAAGAAVVFSGLAQPEQVKLVINQARAQRTAPRRGGP